MNTNIENTTDETFEIEQIQFKPEPGQYPGRFTDMKWDKSPGKNGAERKDLVIVRTLDKADPNGKPFQIEDRFNMLPGGRGKSDFKKMMSAWRGKELDSSELSGLKKSSVVNQRVVSIYVTDHLNHVVFDSYKPEPKPAEANQPSAS